MISFPCCITDNYSDLHVFVLNDTQKYMFLF